MCVCGLYSWMCMCRIRVVANIDSCPWRAGFVGPELRTYTLDSHVFWPVTTIPNPSSHYIATWVWSWLHECKASNWHCYFRLCKSNHRIYNIHYLDKTFWLLNAHMPLLLWDGSVHYWWYHCSSFLIGQLQLQLLQLTLYYNTFLSPLCNGSPGVWSC